MGASSSGLSGSHLKKEAGEREISEERVPLTLERESRDTAAREIAADRIRSLNPDKEPDEVKRLASTISDGKRLQDAYFPSLLQDCTTEDSLHLSIIWRDITSQDSRRELAEAFDKFAAGFEYGPYCATVKIGNTYLEWDNRELVIPQTEIGLLFEESSTVRSSSTDPPHLTHDKGEGQGSVRSSHHPLALEDIEISAVFREDIEVDMSQFAAEKVDALMQTLVCYNTKFNFGILSCNCQHFVSDMLAALEARELPRRYEDCLEHHKRVLVCRGCVDVIAEEFNTHRELDTYVNCRLEEMDEGEKYFCYGHYLLFHAWSKECPHLHTITCSSSNCLSRELRRRI